jgi:hypothetical protein
MRAISSSVSSRWVRSIMLPSLQASMNSTWLQRSRKRPPLPQPCPSEEEGVFPDLSRARNQTLGSLLEHAPLLLSQFLAHRVKGFQCCQALAQGGWALRHVNLYGLSFW